MKTAYKEILIMAKQEMMQYVDTICEKNGYEDGPAYDLIYNECCEGRSAEDAKSLINEMLENYNE